MTIKRAVIGAGLFLLGLFIGILFGFRSGQAAFLFIDAIPRGVLASSQLSALDKGNTAPARFFLEQDIDQSLYYYSLINEQWWHPLYTSHLLITAAPEDIDRYIQKVARYRAENPGVKQDVTLFDKVPPGKEEYASFYSELAKAQRDRASRIQDVIRKHGH